MKVLQLIQKNSFNKVIRTLICLYPKELYITSKYKKLYKQLKKLNSLTLKETIYIDFNNVNDCYDIYLKYKNDSQHYALDFIKRKILVNMKVSNETLLKYSEAEIIAHFLYEITFDGFDERKVQKIRKEIFNYDKNDFVTHEELTKELGYDILKRGKEIFENKQ